MNRGKRLKLIKYILYVLITVLLYCLQMTPLLLDVLGVKPMLVFAFALCIAMFEGSLAGGIFGFISGILCDFGSDMMFGANALMCFLCCVGAALLTIHLIRRTVWTALLTVTVAMTLRAFAEYYLLYGMWSYAGAGAVFTERLLPVAVYSVVFTLLFYPLLGFMKNRMDFEV